MSTITCKAQVFDDSRTPPKIPVPALLEWTCECGTASCEDIYESNLEGLRAAVLYAHCSNCTMPLYDQPFEVVEDV